MSTIANAQPPKDDSANLCHDIGKLASLYARKLEREVPLADLFDDIRSEPSPNNEYKQFVESIAMDVYKRHLTPDTAYVEWRNNCEKAKAAKVKSEKGSSR